MTVLIYAVGCFVVFLSVVALGREASVARGLIRTSGLFSMVLACFVLAAPFRFDVTSIRPASYPVTEDQQRLTAILFAFACFCAAVVLVGVGIRNFWYDRER